MTRLLRAARSVQSFCKRRRWRFCFIGGIAVQRWGEPRLTRDVDLTILTGFGHEGKYIRALLGHFRPRFRDAADFAIRNRVLLLRTAGGVDVDVSLGGVAFEESVVRRATLFAFQPKLELLTCSAEDLVVLKSFAGREQDWVDVAGILVRQGKRLDWRYILRELRPLADLKDSPETLERLKQLRRRGR